MIGHVVIVGYDAQGRDALRTVPDDDRRRGVVVIDLDVDRASSAAVAGAESIAGDGTDTAVLRRAGVPGAHSVLICVASDGDALQITWMARLLDPVASIVVTVQDHLWASAAMDLGADRVVCRDPVASRLVGLRVPVVGGRCRRLLASVVGLVVTERSVLPAEVGRAPAACGPSVVAVVRDGARHWCEHPAVAELRECDRLLVLGAVPSGTGEVDL